MSDARSNSGSYLRLGSKEGLIFLSHSAKDKDYVEPLTKKLDNAILFYDIRSIAPGQKFLDAMKEEVLRANLFVMFVSPNVTPDSWALFEASLAEVRSIKQKSFQVLAVPIKGAKYSDAPKWMTEYMAVPESFTPNDVVRTIKHLYQVSLLAQGRLEDQVYLGREKLQIEIQGEVRARPHKLGQIPNVVILNGIPGIGRSSVAANLIGNVFPAMRPAGPIFELPDAAAAVDFYLHLFEDTRGGLSKEEIEKVIAGFPESPAEQADLIYKQLRHWGELNQPIILKTRWGLRSRGNQIEPFVDALFSKLRQDTNLKLIFITTRRLDARLLGKFSNVLQYEVPGLDLHSVGEVLVKLLGAKAPASPTLFALSEKILGHAATIHYVAMLIQNGRSAETLVTSPADVLAFQDQVLKSIYDEGVLSDLERKILVILSWFPNLPPSVLGRILHGTGSDDIASALWRLFDNSLLNQTDLGNYKVPELVRSRTRRDVEHLDDALLQSTGEAIRAVLSSRDVPIALIDSILMAFAATSGGIPSEVRALITPGTLRDVVEREYDLGRGATSREALARHFETAAAIARLARYLSIPNKHTLEDIYFFGGDSLTRLGKDPSEFVQAMQAEGFSSADYLDATYRFHALRDFEGAIERLKRALAGAYFKRRTVRLLARIYLKLGKAALALDAINSLPPAAIFRDTGLLSMKIKALRATGQHDAAKELESRLVGLEDNFGEVDLMRAASALKAGDIKAAKEHVARAARKPQANRVTVKFFECKVRLEDKDFSTLTEACELARAAGREDDSNHLLARAALLRGQPEDAAQYLEKIAHKHFFDLKLEFSVLESLLRLDRVKADLIESARIKARMDAILLSFRDAPDYVAL